MSDNVNIYIKSIHKNSGQEEIIETKTTGKFRIIDGIKYIYYKESDENGQVSIRNIIKISKDRVEITKKGMTETNMLFVEGEKHESLYSLPYGKFLTRIDTKSVIVEEKETLLKVKLNYIIELEGDFLSDCQLTMEINDIKFE
ncbi:Uncharacterized beta-barrel protein YwiB, DUF1934 family [Acetitomaculum ruminis DSM 5522]|uniref:Uncharacterized beta-barrel protein YwiB, DUF1934 family n=1 Tax=Acetitomaculum ruminis DSM 5522 TaxID=1120918 RepID=A0A1I0W541_9FIRM|nr:DUF1934 domain-containing protein [Acetitomaculum ruminis]SFA83879.1 Uncharacterized beta-barrel protein YwiB, DUF1934 family [Acetitomaculum ruminis DSM 5522]